MNYWINAISHAFQMTFSIAGGASLLLAASIFLYRNHKHLRNIILGVLNKSPDIIISHEFWLILKDVKIPIFILIAIFIFIILFISPISIYDSQKMTVESLETELSRIKVKNASLLQGKDQLQRELNSNLSTLASISKQPQIRAEGLIVTSKEIPSSYPEANYALEIVVQTQSDISPFGIGFEFDKPIFEPKCYVVGTSIMNNVKTLYGPQGLSFIFQLGSPPVTPKNPFVVVVFAKEPIKLIRWKRTYIH